MNKKELLFCTDQQHSSLTDDYIIVHHPHISCSPCQPSCLY